MEEKKDVRREEDREELLRELRELRREVGRLNDRLHHVEGLVYGHSQHKAALYEQEQNDGEISSEQRQYETMSSERPRNEPDMSERTQSEPFSDRRFSQKSDANVRSAYRNRVSAIPEMRRQRMESRENRVMRRPYQVGEMNVGKYGTAFLAAVCILAGCGILMVSAWALADELAQAFLMFGLGIGMAGTGWLLHCKNGNSAVPATLAACGLGILYMDCVSLHFLWHLVPVEGVLACILVWAVISFYMAYTGGTLLFYYVINLGNLATAFLVSSRREGPVETWAGLLFAVAAYGFTLFQVFRVGVAKARENDGAAENHGFIKADGSMSVSESGGTDTAGGQARLLTNKLRWLKNATAVNVLAGYTILFIWEYDNAPLLLSALALGGLVLLFWRDLYQGGAREEAVGAFFMACQLALFSTRLTELSDRWPGAAVCAVVLLLMSVPLIRSRNRDALTAWILFPLLWVGLTLSDLMTGSVYPVPYLILAVYYLSMLLRPAACKMIAFVPVYIVMYLVLIGETSHPEKDITFALMTLFALGVPFKYLVKMMPGRPQDEAGDSSPLTFRQARRYGVAMLAAFVVCVTYCSAFDKPFVLAMEAAMLVVFAGMTLWMKNRDYRFFPILCVGVTIMWLMSCGVLEWCEGDGFGLELAAGILFLLAGSMSAWSGIRWRTEWEQEVPSGLLFFGPPGLPSEYMVRRLSRMGILFCPVSLAMFSVSLYRLVLVFRIPYGIFVSLILLFAAVGILLLGFWMSSRSVRTYALFLMVVCVVKMVTADLAETGWIYRAGALAGGGVLCMIVSLIYSHKEKRQSSEQSSETQKME